MLSSAVVLTGRITLSEESSSNVVVTGCGGKSVAKPILAAFRSAAVGVRTGCGSRTTGPIPPSLSPNSKKGTLSWSEELNHGTTLNYGQEVVTGEFYAYCHYNGVEMGFSKSLISQEQALLQLTRQLAMKIGNVYEVLSRRT